MNQEQLAVISNSHISVQHPSFFYSPMESPDLHDYTLSVSSSTPADRNDLARQAFSANVLLDPQREPVAIALPGGCDLGHLTLGPDGHIWGTATRANRIVRITREGKVTQFDLPRGTHPTEILDYRDGKLIFTTRGGHRIGSIRAVAKEAPATPTVVAPASEEEIQASLERAVQRGIDRARVEEPDEELPGEERQTQAGDASSSEGEEDQRESLEQGPADRPQISAQSSQPQPALSPASRLFGLGVNLTSNTTRPIQPDPVPGRVDERGQRKAGFLYETNIYLDAL